MPIGNANFKTSTPSSSTSSRTAEDRRQKTRSTFWQFASRSERPVPVAAPIAKPVFGVPLADAVAVARVNEAFELPAIV